MALMGPQMLVKRLRSRRQFVPARNLLNNLAGIDIRISQWMNYRWNTEYCENTSQALCFYTLTSTRALEMGLLRTAWVKLNCLRTGVGRFHSSIHKWGPLFLGIASARSLNKPHTISKQPAPYIGHHMEHEV